MNLTDIVKIVCSPEMYPVIELSGWTDDMMQKCINSAVVTYFDEPAQKLYFETFVKTPEIAASEALKQCAVDYYSRMNVEAENIPRYTNEDEILTHIVALNTYPATKCHYVDLLTQGTLPVEAFYWAILNDFIIDALQLEMLRAEQEVEDDYDE